MTLKPIIKYAGGKRSIMTQLTSHFPANFNNYIEPFFGGGSVLFELYNQKRISESFKVYISDIADTLINMYNVIKDKSEELKSELKQQNVYKNNKTIFLEKRIRFNKLKKDMSKLTEEEKLELAAIYIYINRVCFNGMYRENKSGEYNVPFGKQKNPLICNEELIDELSKFFNDVNIDIRCSDYSYIENIAKKDDFIYLDPPYYDTFTDYNKTQFDKKSQKELMECYKRLTEKGCKVALSNSDTEYIRNLYSEIPGIKVIEINVKRVINSKKENRKKELKELLIINY